MKKKWKTVIIGFAHMHVNHVASSFYQHPECEIVACADIAPKRKERKKGPYTRAWNLEFCKREFEIAREYTDFVEMLDKESPDVAIVNSENVWRADIAEACARRGVDIIVEKPMTLNYADALRMARAAREGEILLLTNWPVVWHQNYNLLKELLDSGRIGRVIEFKCRMGHTGPLGSNAKHEGVSETADYMTDLDKGATWWHHAGMGGGAMIDYCCYGSMMALWYLQKKALAVMGMMGNFNSLYGDADDNAAMLIRLEDCYAVIEGSWTTFGGADPYGPVIYGTEGALLLTEDGGVKIALPGNVSETIYPKENNTEVNLADCYVDYKERGISFPDMLLPEYNLRAMAILDAGLRSAESGRMELVSNENWNPAGLFPK